MQRKFVRSSGTVFMGLIELHHVNWELRKGNCIRMKMKGSAAFFASEPVRFCN
jgi:hypothetical protein